MKRAAVNSFLEKERKSNTSAYLPKKMTMRDVMNEARERPVYTKLGAADIPLSSVALNSLVQRDVRESVVISPPSIASGGSVLSRGFEEKPKGTPSSSGIGVNIHRSKQGVFVVR